MNQEVKPILIKGIQIYTEQTQIESGYIKIKNQKIVELGSMEELHLEEEVDVVELPSDYKAIPGFIDVHIHGAGGADVMDATKEALDMLTHTLPGEGTTSFLATTMTQSAKEIEAALQNANTYMKNHQAQGKAEILGMHLEGPFVNANMAGAQPKEHIIDPDLELFKKWNELSGENIKLVTLAPERPGGFEMVRYLAENGIIASIGHSNATYEEVCTAIESGSNHVTHLFNQMRGLHHREPGVVGAAFLHDELKAELIADGIHVRPEVMKLAFKQKQKEGLILITDSMRAKCLKNGHYDFVGQDVTVQDGKAVLSDGTLAGSILKLSHAVKNMIVYAGCSLPEAIEMASVNPAKQLKIYDKKGSLAVRKDADIVILDENLDVYMTFCRGQLAYKNEEAMK